jgi:16S rRNA G966 N2-methylase RsmD
MNRATRPAARDTEAVAVPLSHTPPPRPPLPWFRRALLNLHRHILDRIDAGPERVSTAGTTPLHGLKVVGPNPILGNDYRPSPRHLIRWALDLLPEPAENLTFVDLGSGRGRVVLEAARRPFRRIVGIEFAETLYEDAVMNLRHWPRSLMACREVDLVLDDAATADLPQDDLVVYMFDPFAPRLMTRIAARLAEHGRHHRLYVILVDPQETVTLRESAAFRRIAPAASAHRRLAWASPYDVQLYVVAPPGAQRRPSGPVS